jgi:hypothetical protein
MNSLIECLPQRPGSERNTVVTQWTTNTVKIYKQLKKVQNLIILAIN